jgi:CheY-like chemotaxis protein/DNA-directed RNA polymerase specialized sigma24 family protein
MPRSRALSPLLPFLRRYARALTGSREIGDSRVRAALQAILDGERALDEALPPRLALYRLFHTVWSRAPEIAAAPGPEERLFALSAVQRAALLLTSVEGFSLDDAAAILGTSADSVERSIVEAQHAIEGELASRILIIEDEPIIALDLERLVAELGHEVVGTAATSDEAVALAGSTAPGLVLADINLGEGGSGLDAVGKILSSFDIPVIFVTAYPERLLTGERPEPTYLIAKPFLPESVQATVGQALFFHPYRHKG